MAKAYGEGGTMIEYRPRATRLDRQFYHDAHGRECARCGRYKRIIGPDGTTKTGAFYMRKTGKPYHQCKDCARAIDLERSAQASADREIARRELDDPFDDGPPLPGEPVGIETGGIFDRRARQREGRRYFVIGCIASAGEYREVLRDQEKLHTIPEIER